MVVSKEMLIVNRLGLHARAAAQLVKMANSFTSEITIEREDEHVNAKSIMGILMLAAACGSRIQVTVDGEDAEAAMMAIEELVNDGFGES
jgi:phosphocarrier protein HPr